MPVPGNALIAVAVFKIAEVGLGGYWIYPMLYSLDGIASLKKQLPDYSIHPPSAAYNHANSAQEDWIEPYWNGENSQDFANFKFI